MTTVWTAGHSNRPVEELIEALKRADIELLVDVRRYPASRRNPQFNAEALAATLALNKITYRHAEALGGRRAPGSNSTNLGLRDEGFRGFADYIATPEGSEALETLIDVAQGQRVAVMCAESVPWRCHRSLIADALLARGVEVVHLIGGKPREHALTPSARVEDGRVSYPALL
ncbi:MAG TPA: DUF488 domain-containing protein [Dehalococcoidia bacterium]|nr:DUF488 domain-containing protein [Dehalococcoidia bacterium]